MRNILLLIFTVLFVGCADTHHLTRTATTTSLESSSSIYISIPKDGRYGENTYSGSGLTTAQVVLKAFSVHVTNIETAHEYQSFKEALDYAKFNNFKYFVYPSILEWEDRATEWSGIPDRISIKIAVIDTNSGRTLDSAVIEGKSGLATFGGDKPQDLLAKPVMNYVSLLFK